MTVATAPAPTNTASRPTEVLSYALRRGQGLPALQPRRVSLPELGEFDVQVRIRAVALNHRDLMLVDGRAGPADRWVTPGSDAAGEVVAVGASVRDFRVGDRVISQFFPHWRSGPATPQATALALGGSMDGVLAEQVVLPAAAWLPMPKSLSFTEAATLSCAGVTAWHALFGFDPLTAGASVALLGTGGVSIWALQLAKAAGIRVLITSSDQSKLHHATELGADHTLNYRQTPRWGEALRELNGGEGVDRVLDIGGPDTLAQSIAALRYGGSVAVIGRLTGSAPAQLDPAELFLENKRLVGLMVGSHSMTRALSAFVDQHAIRPVIDGVFGFDQVRDAFAHLASGSHFGKVVIDLDQGHRP